MNVYRCQMELMETTFFASREFSDLYQTEPVLTNYSLVYALRLCESEYHNDGEIHYKRDLERLNERGIYVTPGTIIGRPRFTICCFNAISDSYWYAMGRNTVVIDRKSDRSSRTSNFPQIGRIKALAVGNKAVFFVLSRDELEIPRYVRLGKWMSKAKINVKSENVRPVSQEIPVQTKWNLNPNDLNPETQVIMFDLINIKPCPLLRNPHIRGELYKLEDDTYLPQEMRFGMPG